MLCLKSQCPALYEFLPVASPKQQALLLIAHPKNKPASEDGWANPSGLCTLWTSICSRSASEKKVYSLALQNVVQRPQLQYYLGACWNCRTSGPSLNLLDQKLHFRKTLRWFLHLITLEKCWALSTSVIFLRDLGCLPWEVLIQEAVQLLFNRKLVALN